MSEARTTVWDTWCPHCQTHHYYWSWRAEGLASEYKPVRVCLALSAGETFGRPTGFLVAGALAAVGLEG